MKLKSFIIASLIIHVVGAIALYFYYNPIRIGPQPVSELEKEELEEKALAPPPPEWTAQPHSKPIPKEQSDEGKASWLKKIKKAKKPQKDSTKIETIKPESPLDPSKIKAEKAIEKPIKDKLTPVKKEESQPKKPLKAIAPPPLSPAVPKTSPPLPEKVPDPVIELELKEIPEPSPPPLKTAELESPSVDPLTENAKPSQKSKDMPEPPQAPPPEKAVPEEAVLSFQGKKQKRGNPPLSYPDFARRAGMQGTVSISFFVTGRGLVEQIQLEKSSGHTELDNFVIQTLARYEFLPDQEGWVQQDIPFVLKGEEVEFLQLRQEE